MMMTMKKNEDEVEEGRESTAAAETAQEIKEAEVRGEESQSIADMKKKKERTRFFTDLFKLHRICCEPSVRCQDGCPTLQTPIPESEHISGIQILPRSRELQEGPLQRLLDEDGAWLQECHPRLPGCGRIGPGRERESVRRRQRLFCCCCCCVRNFRRKRMRRRMRRRMKSRKIQSRRI